MTSIEDGMGSPPLTVACDTLMSSQPQFHTLFNYWKDVRNSAIVPPAASVDPASIPQLLKDITILDLNTPDEIIYRLAGTAIVERTGMDPTGLNLLTLVPEHSRSFSSKTLFQVAQHPAGLVLEYENILRNGKRAEMESLYLPIQSATPNQMRLISIHTVVRTIGFEDERPKPEFASVLHKLVWIDIGAGTPLDQQD